MKAHHIAAACLTALAAACAVAGAGEMVTGGHSIELTGPLDDLTSRQVRSKAMEEFGKEVHAWLEVHLLCEWDRRNGIDRLHLEDFVNECATRARQNASFSGNRWIFQYSFPSEQIASNADVWNNRHKALGVQSYVRFNAAREAGQLQDIYVFGMRTIYHARALLGPRSSIPGTSGKDFIYETSAALKELLEHLTISTTDAILSGKPGFAPDNDVILTARFNDSIPLPGLKLGVKLHSGPNLANTETDAAGRASLGGLIMPYVPTGRFFNVVPNPGAEVKAGGFFEFKDLDLGLSRDYSQTLMFKITRPTYTLAYKTTSASDLVVPRDISDQSYLVKYLRDSCHIDPAPAAAQADIEITVRCQVSAYDHDPTEQHVLKSEIYVTVKELSSPRKSAVMQDKLYERTFKYGTDVARGLFFWETAREIGALVSNSLLSL